MQRDASHARTVGAVSAEIMDKFLDADEALAHIVLWRDGKTTISDIFNKTLCIPKKYIKKYSRVVQTEDLSQIAYAAHIAAIHSFPINSGINFFGWAGNTIRRDIVDHIKHIRRMDIVADVLKEASLCVLSECECPEQAYTSKECRVGLSRAVNKIGEVNKRAILELMSESPVTHQSGTYFKHQKQVARSLKALTEFKDLRDYI